MQRTKKSAELWGRIREKITRGALIKEAAEEYGVSIASITMRASRERWQIQAMRNREKGKHLVLGEAVAREIGLEVEALGARMRRSSLKCKVAMAEEVERLLRELQDADEMGVVARSRCLANLASVCQKLHRWNEEPVDSVSTKHHAINLSLIRTEPAQLRAMALEKGMRLKAPDSVTEAAPSGVVIEPDKGAVGKGVTEQPDSETLSADPQSSISSASTEPDGAQTRRKKDWEEWRQQSRQKMR